MVDPFEKGAADARAEADQREARHKELLSQQVNVCANSDEFLDHIALKFKDKFVIRHSSGILFVSTGSYEEAASLSVHVPSVSTDLGYFRIGGGFDVVFSNDSGVSERGASEERVLELAGRFFGRHEWKFHTRVAASQIHSGPRLNVKLGSLVDFLIDNLGAVVVGFIVFAAIMDGLT